MVCFLKQDLVHECVGSRAWQFEIAQSIVSPAWYGLSTGCGVGGFRECGGGCWSLPVRTASHSSTSSSWLLTSLPCLGVYPVASA